VAGQRELTVPVERLDSEEARANGRALFVQKCALCHGMHADGRGVRQHGLSNKPADFTSQTWRSGVTPSSVYRVLREGEQGTSMPAWPSLSEGQTWDLVAYVLSVSEEGP
jgi:high-affinity iron transporter